jgi:type IV pilus assembly protein PilF
MRERKGYGILFFLLLLGGCQAGNMEARPGVDTEQIVPEDGQIMERADARTRAKAHVELASAYYEAGRLAISLEEADIALKSDPTYAPAYNIKGLVNYELRENAAAEATFKRGLALAPQDPDLNHNYGWFLCRTGRELESTLWFMNAVKNPLYQTPARSYLAAANCVQTKNPTDAQDFLDRALRVEPNNPAVLLGYAEFLYRQDRPLESKALLDRYQKAVGEPNAEGWWLLLRVARKLNDRVGEASSGAQLRKRFPNSPQAAALQRGAYN